VGARTASRALAAALAALAAVLAAPGAATARPPSVGARAAIVVDARTGERLFARSPDARRAIASTTKLMTALLTLERTRPEQVFASPGYTVSFSDESQIGLRRGERMTVHDLLRALLLASANDAAFDLAVNEAGSARRFVRLMNQRARALGLMETHYANPIGLDSPGNYSSARDLARLASYLLRMPQFARIVDLPRARLTSGSHPRTVANRNDLVGRYPFVDGVKTGHTQDAGYVLVGAGAARGAEVVSVVLGEPSEGARDADTLALLRWGLAQYRRTRPVVAHRTYARAHVRYFAGRKVRLVAARSVYLTVRRGRRLRVHAQAPRELTGPLPRGRRVGTLEVIYQGRVVRSVPLLTATPVPEAGPLRKVASALGGPLPAVALLVFAGAAALAAFRVRRRRGRRRGAVSDDHHGHPQRRHRQDPRRSELPPRAAASGGRADRHGRRQGR
jgi:D-alanyl-D-alanine carboxypeptidase (penicillin-binding protein 5/6)